MLEEATLQDVHKACSQNDYTHVHILAHGVELQAANGEVRYGLAFHAEENRNEVDLVSGERLASALRCHLHGEPMVELSRPAVVTIASCDSANVGSVVAPGASVAHALHEQGIPLVVGSQFPLSVKGSIIMAELLYRRLFMGDDPRIIIHDLRQRLHTACPETHDWASLVVYAALPNDLHEQLQRTRFAQARTALDILMRRSARLLVPPSTSASPAVQGTSRLNRGELQTLPEMRRQIMKAMDQFEEAAPEGNNHDEQVEAWGMLASACKQIASLLAVEGPSDDPEFVKMKPRGTLLRDPEFRAMLEKARLYYHACYRLGWAEAWPLVQYLALTVGLRLHEVPGGSKVSRTFKRLWGAAVARAEDNLNWGTPQQRAWAYSSLAELALLSVLWRPLERCRAEALRYTKRALDIKRMNQYDEADSDALSLSRQLERYVRFHWGTEDMRNLAFKMWEVLEQPLEP